VEYIKKSIENTNHELYGNGKPGLKTRLQSVEFVICIIKWVGITSAGAFRPLSSEGAITVDTTIANTLDVTYTWGTADASNTITTRIATIDIQKIN